MNLNSRSAQRTLPILIIVLLLAGGCSSTRQIETSPPRTIDASGHDTSASRQARLIIAMQEGETSLPDDVDRFEFRIGEIRLHQKGGNWIRLPADVNQVTLPLHRDARRTLLDGRVAPAEYDSVALSFDHLFARFGPNAGAPLTAAEGEPLRLALDITTSLDEPTFVMLQFEPGASLRRSPDCKWFFIPVVMPSVSRSPSSPDSSGD